MSIMPKKLKEKAEGTLIWTENKQPSKDVPMLPEGIYEQMIVYTFLFCFVFLFWITGP